MTTADLKLLGKKEKTLHCQQTARKLLLQGKSVAETLEMLKAQDLWNSSFNKVSEILKIMSKKGLIAKDAILDVSVVKAESIGEFLSDYSFLFDQKDGHNPSELASDCY